MTPLEKIFMLNINTKLDFETMKRIGETGHSRVPVYEEVEVPSDVEGYDVGPSTGRPGGDVGRQTSWFGWGGGAAQSEKKRE